MTWHSSGSTVKHPYWNFDMPALLARSRSWRNVRRLRADAFLSLGTRI
jgi:hypothetical protein